MAATSSSPASRTTVPIPCSLRPAPMRSSPDDRLPTDTDRTPTAEEHTLGAIKVHEFTTVDGVVDVPMWTADYGFPDDLSAIIAALTGAASGILLGRRTFEMFAPAWSTRTVEDDPGAPFFNDSPKYVVSSALEDAESVWR